ncbi:MAG: hypothetical protein AAF411_17395 [Myxococcota bacterium]
MAIRELLDALHEGGVDFVVIGGVAMVARGSSRATFDLDICHSREKSNLERLAAAITPFRPVLRGADPGLPFLWDAQTLRSGLNFTLRTEVGDLDLLGEVPGLGAYDAVLAASARTALFGRDTHVLTLDGLERAKRAAGRAKDFLDLATIEELKRL